MLKLEHFQDITYIQSDWLWLIIVLPLLGAVVNGLLSFPAIRKGLAVRPWVYSAVACIAALSTFMVSWEMFLHFKRTPDSPWVQSLFSWMDSGSFHADFSLELNSLSAVMIVFVTFIAGLIHLYSAGFMKDDDGLGRYFAYLNLLLFSMLILVLAQNLLVLFLGWEGIGFCSYLLIGFWFEDNAAAEAGQKAVVFGRVGDLGFIAALLIVFVLAGTFDLNDLLGRKQAFTETTATIIGLLFFFAAAVKSAQVPLYLWRIPDAMTGPVPVSAFIYAVTMTAGVYLVVRLHFLYVLAPWDSILIAVVGCLTALAAAVVALVQNDIKKILAYSTASQLGFMFLGVGVTSYESGIFHLITHGFLKACLFLAVGSVIYALDGEQDIRKMGGLLKHLPLTSLGFLLGWIAISGLLPTFGEYFSKDEILWKTLAIPNPIFPVLPQILYFAGLAASFLTTFYMTRLMFLVFFGHYRGDREIFVHLREPSRWMTWPILLLGVGSLLAGWIGIPASIGGADELGKFLDPIFHLSTLETDGVSSKLEPVLMLVSFLAAWAAALGAWYVYGFKPSAGKSLSHWLPGLKKALEGKQFKHEFYNAAVVHPVRAVARWVSGWVVETLLINRPVEWMVKGVMRAAQTKKRIQTGFVRIYPAYVAAGAALLVYLLLH